MKHKTLVYTAAVFMILLGALFLFGGLLRPVTIVLDGFPIVVQTRAVTVNGLLKYAGVELQPGDRVSPGISALLGWSAVVQVDRSRMVQIWTSPVQPPRVFNSHARDAGNLLAEAGLRWYSGDRVKVNGMDLTPNQPLPLNAGLVLQFIPASGVTVDQDGRKRLVFSAAPTVGEALWEQGYRPRLQDSVSVALDRPLTAGMTISIRTARRVTIGTAADEVLVLTAAETIGEALADAGLTLQGLDYTVPDERQAIPNDLRFQVVRVRDEWILAQEAKPFTNEFVEDATLPLGQTGIVEPGQYGIEAVRERIRWEDGQEVSREEETRWTAAEARAQKSGYGTRVEIQTIDTPSGPVEYYRAVTVYATSYSPCRSGTEKCYPGTASGMKVQRGVIGVTRAWYNLFAGQRVYVPGYGVAVIGDVGGGVPGRYWIDLGFSDEDFEAWHQNVTIYFLTPVPENVPWILP